MRSPFITELSNEKNRGISFGIVNSITTICTAIGAASAGLIYQFIDIHFLFVFFFVALIIAFIMTLFFLPKVKFEKRKNEIFTISQLLNTNKVIWVFCIVLFLQNVVTAPLWSMVLPIYFVKVLGYSVAVLGIIMSIDELLGSPTSLISGYLSDKMNSKLILWLSFMVAGLIISLSIFVKNEIGFIVIFLLTSIFVASTFTCLEKVESEYVRESSKGFDFGLISFSASIGNALGSLVIGHLVNNYSMVLGFISFSVVYIVIGLIIIIFIKSKKNTIHYFNLSTFLRNIIQRN